MKHIVCAVRDSAADTFQRPFFVQTPAVAVRLFGDECKRANEDNPMNNHPEHFELFELGIYDDSSAKFDMLDSPRSLCRAVDFKPRAELKAAN
jgi:hypothetical protein